MAERTKRTPKARRDWKPAFLQAFAELGMVGKACEQANIGRTAVYKARHEDAAFAQAWEDIENDTTDRMEREAFRRAVEGVKHGIFQGGKLVGAEVKYSDTLLIFMLKARKPGVYRDNVSVEHSGPGGGPIEMVPVAVDRAGDVARILAGTRAVASE